MTQEPKNYIEFCSSLKELLCDKEFLTENVRTSAFLEAMQAWLFDTNGGKEFFESCDEASISWNDLLKLIQAAAVYE